MQPHLIILIFVASVAFARFHEKTRFDRSIYNEEYDITNAEDNDNKKQWSFTDDVTQFVAYKIGKENDCYLEDVKQIRKTLLKKRQPVTLYPSTILTKFEAWRLAGGRIVDFCNGRKIILLQKTRPIPGQTFDPFLNEIPIDENDIFPKRIADVVLTPLKARTKRHIQLEQRKKLNANTNHILQRRQTSQFRGKFRGQTQSQYLNLGNTEQNKEGKAEAEATQHSSHAVVSGSRGIGQAQSMSSGGTGCEDCPGYPGYSGIDGKLDKVRIPSTDGIPGIGMGITRSGAGITPGGVISGGQIIYPGGTTPTISTYPGMLPGIGTRVYSGGVQPGIVMPATDERYPGVVSPGDVQPALVRPGTDGTYPGGVLPGPVRPGADGTYPGRVLPGPVRPGADKTYPGGVQPGTVRPGADGTYPGDVQSGTVRPGADGTYPGRVLPGPVRPGADKTYPGGVQPGTVRLGADGTYPGGVQSGTVRPGADGTYPGGVLQPGVYPPGTLVTGGHGIYPGGIQPGEPSRVPIVDTGIGTYPGGIQRGIQPGQASYPSSGLVTTSVTTSAITGAGAYPSGIAPTGLPAGIYPAGIPGAYPGIYPSGVRPAPGTGVVTYPGGIIPERTIPGSGQIVYPGGGTLYPSGPVAGTLANGGQIPGVDGSQVVYPSGTVQPGRTPEGAVSGTRIVYPDGTHALDRGTMSVTYPRDGSTQQITSPGGILYPGHVTYPSRGEGQVQVSGQYPGAGTESPGGTSIPGGTGIPGSIQYPKSTGGPGQIGIGQIGETGITGQYFDQYPGGISGLGTGQYPGRVYPGGTGEIVGAGKVSPVYTQSGVSAGADDGAESQASSSVQQIDSDTQASASAQGKYGSGTAQSQVTGTYSGTGSFSAQAGTSDANKSAQTEIHGGEQGATSNAQGVAGHGKSQTQVQLDSDSGTTSTDAQSSGWNHGTNSQVQASSKGGMADAQANGEGSTSSQAQIGFQPYLKNEAEKEERRTIPFRGSGTASAQSGTYRGQSQSQLQGSFQYGITYTGAAQAGSGSGAASLRKPFNFSIIDTELFKPFKPPPSLNKPTNNEESGVQPIPSTRSNYESERGLQSSSTSRQIIVMNSKDDSTDNINRQTSSVTKSDKDDVIYDDDYDDEYTDEEDYPTAAPSHSRLSIQENFPEALTTSSSNSDPSLSKIASQQSYGQSQAIQVAKKNRYDLHISQDSNVPQTGDSLQPGQFVGGFTIPPGFRGRVISTSGTETVAQGDGKSQSQTVSLVPPKYLNNTRAPVKTRSLETNHEHYNSQHIPNDKTQRSSINQNASSYKYVKPIPAVAVKPSYYTVTNSVAGKMNGNNEPKKYEHRYYTKSSTCGYFTFSCNVVYGSNGRTKICKPKMPTYSDGTPIRC